MAEHDPADADYMKRLLCKAVGTHVDQAHRLHNAANRALDWMQANGVKMTDKHSVELGVHSRWDLLHDSAPLTPRSKR